MIVMDRDGNLFDERRKLKDRRKRVSDNILNERRKGDRRKEDINAPKKKK